MNINKLKLIIAFILSLNAQNLHLQNENIKQNNLLNEYFKLGVPTLNKLWSADEYASTITLILDLNKKNIIELPTYKNETSNLVSKIFDSKELWFLESKSFNNNNKILFVSQILPPIGELVIEYVNKGIDSSNKLIYSKEILSGSILMLKIAKAQLTYLNGFLKENPNLNEQQKLGMETVNKGLNSTISGSLYTLEKESKYYNDEDICLFSENFFNFYKDIEYRIDRIDSISKNEFDKKIENLSLNHELECVKKEAVKK